MTMTSSYVFTSLLNTVTVQPPWPLDPASGSITGRIVGWAISLIPFGKDVRRNPDLPDDRGGYVAVFLRSEVDGGFTVRMGLPGLDGGLLDGATGRTNQDVDDLVRRIRVVVRDNHHPSRTYTDVGVDGLQNDLIHRKLLYDRVRQARMGPSRTDHVNRYNC